MSFGPWYLRLTLIRLLCFATNPNVKQDIHMYKCYGILILSNENKHKAMLKHTKQYCCYKVQC